MIKNTIKKYVIALFVGIAALAAADEIRADVPLKLDTLKTPLLLPRPAFESVNSLNRYPDEPIDTLDTAHEFIKVLLYANNTWQYYKTPEYQQTVDAFDEAWSHAGVNPYGVELSEMPAQWSIWCAL